MSHPIDKQRHANEKGQTLLLVAVSLFTLIAMAALAIDLTTLYAARGEMQRAADAAALAAAKAFVETGTTTAPSDPNLQNLARNIATAYVNSYVTTAGINVAGGVSPQLAAAPTFDFSRLGNPQVTVTLQRTDVPTYFARIFGSSLITVKATATAEAYNSSNPPGGGGANMPPVAPSCVKPWLIPNEDPQYAATPFINETDGTIANPYVYGATPNSGIVGERIQLQIGVGLTNIATGRIAPNTLNYFPAALNAATNAACPSCAGLTDYEQSSACCDSANSPQYANACGTGGTGIALDIAAGLLTNTVDSVECLIGSSSQGLLTGQDEIGLGSSAQGSASQFGNFLSDNGNDPIEIRGFGLAHGGMASGSLVNTSPSIVTLPIYRVAGLSGLLSLVHVQIIGYLQGFIEETSLTVPGEIDIYVLNVAGCGANVTTGLTPVTGGGVSPVPVRLIHQ